MICKKCLVENNPDDKFCINCGASLEEVAETEESAVEEVIEDVTEEAVEDVSAEENIDEVIEEVEEDAIEELAEDISDEAEVITEDLDEISDEPKKGVKGAVIAAIIAVIAVVAIVASMFSIGKGVISGGSDIDRAGYDISYVKDSSLYIASENGNPVKVSEALTTEAGLSSLYSYTTLQSADGKATFFLENYDINTYAGTLYYTTDGINKIKIDDGVLQNFVITNNGKKIMYLKNVDINTAAGTLYIANVGSDPVEVAANVQYGTFMFSTNGSYAAYISDLDQATSMGALKFFATKDLQVADIDTNVIYAYKISDSGEIIYSKDYNQETYACDLYYKALNKDSELISSGISDSYVMLDENSSKAAFVEYVEDGESISYNFKLKAPGKDKEDIMDNIIGFFGVDVTAENFLLAKMADGVDITGMEELNPNIWLKKKGSEAVMVAENMYSPSHAFASEDYSSVIYINNFDATTGVGDLAIASAKGTSTPIASGVSTFFVTPDHSFVAYLADINPETGDGTLYSYKKGTIETIAENVSSINVVVSPDGKSIVFMADMDYNTNTGDLYYASVAKPAEKVLIDSQVTSSFYVRGNDSVIYNKNLNAETYTTDLYHWNGKESTLLDSGVELVLFEG